MTGLVRNIACGGRYAASTRAKFCGGWARSDTEWIICARELRRHALDRGQLCIEFTIFLISA